MAAEGTDICRERIAAPHINGYMVKPLDIEQLINIVSYLEWLFLLIRYEPPVTEVFTSRESHL